MEITPFQQEIMLVAIKLIERHYVLEINALNAECQRMMKDADKSVIRDAIQDLVHRRYLVNGKAVTRQQLMNNENRAHILALIHGEPGIHFSRVKELLQKEPRTVAWHIKMLEKFDFIREARFGNNVVYFDYMQDKQYDTIYYYLHKDGIPAILKAIMNFPGISFMSLLDTMQMPRTTLSRKIKVLEELGFLIALYENNQIASIRVHDDLLPVLQAIFAAGLFS